MFSPSRRATFLISAIATVGLLSAACSSADAESDGGQVTAAAGYNLTADQNRITTDKVDSIAAEVPQAIRDRGTLRVTGSAGAAPPLRFYADDDTTLIGSETDFAYLIGDVLGLKVDLQTADWAQNFVRIDSGEADAFLSNVTVTEERKEKYDFATYRLDTLAFEAKKGSGISIKEPKDVAGKKIAVGSGTNQEALLVKWSEQNVAAGLAPTDISYYQNTTDYYLPLQSGRIDAYFGPNPSSQFHAKQSGETEVVGEFSGAGDTLQGQIAVLVKKDNGLIKAINDAINHTIENGTYQQILERWNITNEAVDTSLINPPGLPKTK
ncbi:ABC transporter substrate-binding protein [Rhodococcus erythropolis]|jgi:polar amino acid transport system substrate-binding protein|uniref:ABC transporter substrate-binding protein n=1 Tax=Rhodococcus TaxID=1827 RepID=UPI000BB3B1EA|nr:MULTISPECIES: ABC transporter substrate-binding protein [Rhodococcus]MDI9957661.1 ABC transporter substrate-binding protein [Rhodococcus sp. IEGM 1237]MDI9963116.1 ABC transporter substrate-binding protein [Rhodococcus sp. IEGM 1251]MDV8124987.1 ABC transporter substrate-binding protein [Rhodococcus sp. IEGM 1304]PBI92629.1 Cystine-binding periplasmic protein precursor [Rhodococcus erythropolis]RQO47298.1 ABC transporter substrate-binding protein [Rhodococcus sp. KBW08]